MSLDRSSNLQEKHRLEEQDKWYFKEESSQTQKVEHSVGSLVQSLQLGDH